MSTVVVFGGSEFLGWRLVRRLAENGLNVNAGVLYASASDGVAHFLQNLSVRSPPRLVSMFDGPSPGTAPSSDHSIRRRRRTEVGP